MVSSKQAPETGPRRHATTETVGRQLRAAFDPVPTKADDFADLLAQLDAIESGDELTPAE
ncbi:hypothetical protein ACFOMD_05675 [Sphingoaurantiacus capsulatus]|uniref:Anti-sigma factor NepR domain-containing protein n=1 Tax=Sphingoaurantiacus capsulatus TaxID=1771310 RepID=A0ABV7X884_9SPHN